MTCSVVIPVRNDAAYLERRRAPCGADPCGRDRGGGQRVLRPPGGRLARHPRCGACVSRKQASPMRPRRIRTGARRSDPVAATRTACPPRGG
ncbi:hypothetical protein QJS66_13450 [Kocuria rhizophila]|nr:hypothetical protein QJS66_13450 [Kocuria rhizophila]